MIDHIGLRVADLERSKAFYMKALAPLGYGIVMEVPVELTGGVPYIGFGGMGDQPQDIQTGKPSFWIGEGPNVSGPAHIAFVAANTQAVDAFYAAALDAGGVDNGTPGLRPEYHPGYYGAFVLDPDGHNVEAVCHTASGRQSA